MNTSNRFDDSAEATAWTPSATTSATRLLPVCYPSATRLLPVCYPVCYPSATDPVCYHDTNFGRVADILGEVGRLGGSSSSGSGQVINWLSCSIRDDGEQ